MMSKAKNGRQLLFEHLRVLTQLPSGYLKSQNDQMNEHQSDLPRRVASRDSGASPGLPPTKMRLRSSVSMLSESNKSQTEPMRSTAWPTSIQAKIVQGVMGLTVFTRQAITTAGSSNPPRGIQPQWQIMDIQKSPTSAEQVKHQAVGDLLRMADFQAMITLRGTEICRRESPVEAMSTYVQFSTMREG